MSAPHIYALTTDVTSWHPDLKLHSLLQEGKGASSTAVTDPQVLHCLAEYLLDHEPGSAHALQQTCRAAASAVQQAVSTLSVVAQHVDIVHAVHTFSGLSQLKCTQCALTCQVCVLLPLSSREGYPFSVWCLDEAINQGDCIVCFAVYF